MGARCLAGLLCAIALVALASAPAAGARPEGHGVDAKATVAEDNTLGSQIRSILATNENEFPEDTDGKGRMLLSKKKDKSSESETSESSDTTETSESSDTTETSESSDTSDRKRRMLLKKKKGKSSESETSETSDTTETSESSDTTETSESSDTSDRKRRMLLGRPGLGMGV